MRETPTLDEVVARLSADLKPVRRLPHPARRAAHWIAVACAMALALACVCDFSAFAQRLAAAPDLRLTLAGSTLTAVSAALAAFQLSVPGRGIRWAMLPLPALILWMSASGLGCWLTPAVSDPDGVPFTETRHCFAFILMLSVPLMAVMVLMLRRACPLHPTITALVAGLAVAAAAASLMNLFHPYDASITDLVVHGAAVMLVIGLNQLCSRRLVGHDQPNLN